MKTTYLNPFNQESLAILKNYGNISQISEKTGHINEIIKNTYNQNPRKIESIQELCYDKIRYYYQKNNRKTIQQYNYLFSDALEEEDIISTHALLQATAITHGEDSKETEYTLNTLKAMLDTKLEHTPDYLLDQTLNEYIDIHNTSLKDLLKQVGMDDIKLNELLITDDKIIITYDDFLKEYSTHLKNRRPENIYKPLCGKMKKHLIHALITQKIREYIHNITTMLKKVEPAPIIKEIGKQIQTIQTKEQKQQINNQYNKNTNYTNYNDDQPTPYITEAFPPCIQRALRGTQSGTRNFTISLFLTPFLSYARLYPGVYSRHIKKPKITDMDPHLSITRGDILPLIERAAQNCTPPLLTDQPQEKTNIHSKLGFGEGEINIENCGKTPWYTPMNCTNIKQQQPSLCTPCTDCAKIGNPLSYYNRKRKLLTRKEGRQDAKNGN